MSLIGVAQERLTSLRDLFTPHSEPTIPGDLPEIPREYLLMSLAAVSDTLTRSQVDRFAEQLQQTPNTAIAEICTQVTSFNNMAKRISKDPVLTRFGLIYDSTEFEKESGSTQQQVDLIAGEGPQRPLVMELNSLYGIGLLARAEINGDNQYAISDEGRMYHEAIKIGVKYTNWGRGNDPLIMVGQSSRTAIQKSKS